MARRSDARKKFLAEASIGYHESLPASPAEEHLAKRGLLGPSVREAVARFRLGYVADPLPGHEMYRGMLALPYLRITSDKRWSVVTIRFRCLVEGCEHNGHGKYMSLLGDRPRLYNTLEIIRNDDKIGIAEGELDAITATVLGVPTVGVPGADAWAPHFREPFLGYDTVFVFADGDKAGMAFARTVAGELPNATVIPMPTGEDINSTAVKFGKAALRERIKR